MVEKLDSQKVTMLVPVKVLKAVEHYQQDKGIPNRTVAFIELVRRGLSENDLPSMIRNMMEKGYSNEEIGKWVAYVVKVVDVVRDIPNPDGKIKVFWDDDLPIQPPGGIKSKYTKEEKQEIIKNLEENFSNPGFIPPWEKDFR